MIASIYSGTPLFWTPLGQLKGGVLISLVNWTLIAGTDFEIFHRGWLSRWLPILYHNEPWGWLASNDTPIPIIHINK